LPGCQLDRGSDSTSPLPTLLVDRARSQQIRCEDLKKRSNAARAQQFEPMSVTVRNTFVHVDCRDAEHQPGLSRADSDPFAYGDRCQRVRAFASIPEDNEDEQICDDAAPIPEKASRQDDQSPVSTLPAYPMRVQQLGCDMDSAFRRKVGRAMQEPPMQTTIMLRNLPNGYTRDDVLGLLAFHGFAGRIDFLYWPIDFETRAGLGYAFVNTHTQMDAEQLWRCMEGFSNWSLPSSKVCHVSWSKPLQGLEAHVERYRNSPLMHEAVPDMFRPMLFDCRGERVPFPAPTKKVKAPRKGTKLMLA